MRLFAPLAVAIIAGVLNFIYTRSVARTNRRADAEADTFVARISSPCETILGDLEQAATEIEAAALQDTLPKMRRACTICQRRKIDPAVRKLESILQRAQSHEKWSWKPWLELLDESTDAVSTGLDVIASRRSDLQRAREGAAQVCDALHKACADLRARIDSEIERITSK